MIDFLTDLVALAREDPKIQATIFFPLLVGLLLSVIKYIRIGNTSQYLLSLTPVNILVTAIIAFIRLKVLNHFIFSFLLIIMVLLIIGTLLLERRLDDQKLVCIRINKVLNCPLNQNGDIGIGLFFTIVIKTILWIFSYSLYVFFLYIMIDKFKL